MSTFKKMKYNPLSGEIEYAADTPSEGGGAVNPTATKNAVTFYDYDGKILYSYTAEEFLALTEMPPLPTQPGLICQEWNWSYKEALGYVYKYGVLNVGATYITDDGKTRLYIHIVAEGRMDVPLYFNQTMANGVTIDWGDGSATETLDGTGNVNTTHHYNAIGDYCISLDVAEGCTLGLGHDSNSYTILSYYSNYNERLYANMLQKLEIGKGVTSIGIYATYYCHSLSSVIIPSGVTSIGEKAFFNCYNLSSVVIPSSLTSIESEAFGNCYSLSSVVLSSGVTSIESEAFDCCYSLSSVIIPSSLTSIGDNVFWGCNTLSSVVIPSSLTSIGAGAFRNCHSLSSVIISSGVTSIGANAFSYCYSLSSVIIPSSLTSIGDYVFNYCYGMAYYDFSNHTSVPTLSNKNAFNSISSDCKIVVPDALYNTWIAATNWSTYASKIIKKSDWDNE